MIRSDNTGATFLLRTAFTWLSIVSHLLKQTVPSLTCHSHHLAHHTYIQSILFTYIHALNNITNSREDHRPSPISFADPITLTLLQLNRANIHRWKFLYYLLIQQLNPVILLKQILGGSFPANFWFSDKIGNFKVAFSKTHTHTHTILKVLLKRLGWNGMG